MKTIEITTMVMVNEDSNIKSKVNVEAHSTNNKENEAAVVFTDPGCIEVTPADEERYALASDLANVCEYLTESEVIKIRLIVSKAEGRKTREL